MHLRDYLARHGISRKRACEEIPCNPSWLSRALAEGFGVWPERARIERIRDWSDGAVGADDWLPPRVPKTRGGSGARL